MEDTGQQFISPELRNRAGRREFKKKYGIWFEGTQDSSEATHQEYLIPLKRTSRAGVEYTYYKKVIDVKKVEESVLREESI